MKKHTIYILLTYSGSVLSKVINKYTKEPYSHVSIAFDEELKELYSFGRLRPRNPIFAGFVREDIESGTYARFPQTTCALYSLEINNIQYRKLMRELQKFKKDGDKYGYNLIGLIGVMVNYPVERKYNYFCSQFVSSLLNNSGIKLINKHTALTSPRDFRECKELNLVYEGNLQNYNLSQSYIY
ncbi:hypothetical protein [Tissierella sp.]|uniref:hypothetical protein n=1 Tax=Tissierella sp. TaxID=41274 RepID=UPI002854FE35|nr:hypothetical protein [Tissierella sp.]MDR7856836.1 hypothetical protein [Tissierella sp.]